MKVAEFMSANVITVSPEDKVEKVAQMLLENKISGLPVVDEKEVVVGIITEGDLVLQSKKAKVPVFTVLLGGSTYIESRNRFFELLHGTINMQVKDLMTKKVYTLPLDATLEEAVALMVSKKINRIPIVDNTGKLKGIVTRQDVVNAILMEKRSTSSK